MKTFLVFEPAQDGREPAAASRVKFLPDRFRWLALLFAPLWLLWHRLWLAFACWFVAVIVLSLIVAALDADPRIAAPVLWLPTLIVAFEGSELIRRRLLRRGFREAGVIIAGDVEEAEERFFAARPKPAGQIVTAPRIVVPASMPAAANPVVGLFPEPGGRR